jgi:hypothetical protein
MPDYELATITHVEKYPPNVKIGGYFSLFNEKFYYSNKALVKFLPEQWMKGDGKISPDLGATSFA